MYLYKNIGNIAILKHYKKVNWLTFWLTYFNKGGLKIFDLASFHRTPNLTKIKTNFRGVGVIYLPLKEKVNKLTKKSTKGNKLNTAKTLFLQAI